MVRFLRSWLVPILALLMLAGIAIAFVPLTERAQARAEKELSLLMDRAFEHVGAGVRLTSPVIAAEEENLTSKAVAVARFLEHDDALLETDALKALCEQLTIDRIDVADVEGTLIASSDETRVSLPLGAQDAFAWTMAAADDASAALTQADETNPSVLYACVGRTDIEGFVLLARDDPYVSAALADSGVEAAIENLSYSNDVVLMAETGGEDGFFQQSGNLCLRRTADGVTLIAARPLGDVFAARNAALYAVCAALICVLICGITAYLLQLETVVASEDETSALEAAEAAGLLPDETEAETDETQKLRARRKAGKRSAQDGQPPPEEPDEQPEPPEQTEESVKQTEEKPKSRRPRKPRKDEPEESSEESFEKIVE